MDGELAVVRRDLGQVTKAQKQIICQPIKTNNRPCKSQTHADIAPA